MKRLDDLNRTERYFTSTLFGGLMFHNNLEGVRKFLNWLIEKKGVLLNAVNGSKIKIPLKLPQIDPDHIEVITEFNIKRDLKYYNNSFTELDTNDFTNKQNVPDIILIYGDVLIVIEGKFFVSGQSPSIIDQQLLKQKEEIQLMIEYLKPEINYWSHIYLGPDNKIRLSNCDLQLTWYDIEKFSEDLLIPNHYITTRLSNANKRYSEMNNTTLDNKIYSGKCSFTEVIKLCEDEGDKIIVGFTGGINELNNSDYSNLVCRDFKWDYHNNMGGKTKSNWLNGVLFLKIVNGLAKNRNSEVTSTSLNYHPKSKNYADTNDFDEIKSLCYTHRDKILVGFTGGKNELQVASLKDLETRKFKYDFKNELQGKKTMSNWINGKVFIDIISQKQNNQKKNNI